MKTILIYYHNDVNIEVLQKKLSINRGYKDG